ncbi:MAG: alpha/beta hydrolase family protein [Sphingomicrobium sp.]
MSESPVDVLVDKTTISGTWHEPNRLIPGVLFVHGWGSNQGNNLQLARSISRLGCICFTFDLRGHAATSALHGSVTPEENMADVLAAYDLLATHDSIDKDAIAVIGSSYGGYLAAILTSMRPVDWLILRVPALYRDSDWKKAKAKIDRQDLNAYRDLYLEPEDNRALRACAQFGGDALVVESEKDTVVAHPAVASYAGAFRKAHSLSHRVLDGADHGLTDAACRDAYYRIVARWMSEMISAAREHQ